LCKAGSGVSSPEDSGDREVPSVSRIASHHHILCVEHLTGELGHGERAVLLSGSRHERREAGHEEVQSWERNHVHGQLAQVRVQLTGEPQTSCHSGHGQRHLQTMPCLFLLVLCLVCKAKLIILGFGKRFFFFFFSLLSWSAYISLPG